jgi:hypothetical protein
LAARRTNEFGKAPGDIEAVMSWLGVFEDRHKELGAVMFDATQTPPVVIAAALVAPIGCLLTMLLGAVKSELLAG